MTKIQKLFVTALSLVVAVVLKKRFSSHDYVTILDVDQDTHYDFIIVGSGTGGSVISSILSSNHSKKILVLEAGGPESWLSRIALLAPVQMVADQTWGYQTTPQEYSHFGYVDQVSLMPRGKFLGGTGNMNFFVHNVTSSENDRIIREHLSQPEKMSKLLESFLKASDEHPEGKFHPMASLISAETGTRNSIFDIFLKPRVSQRNSNIDLMIHAEVKKLVFNESSVVSLTVLVNGKQISISTTNSRVILTGGSINTPLLLMKSGIGPKNDLKNANVKVIKDQPVGEGLTDAMAYPVYFHLDQSSDVSCVNLMSLINPLEWIRYLLQGRGLLASSGIEGQALFERDRSLIILYSVGAPNSYLFVKASNLRSDTFEALFPDHWNPAKKGMILLAICLNPHSRGYLKLKKTNGEPEINPNYLKDSRDLDCMKTAIRHAIAIGQSTTMKSLGSTLHVPRFKECLQYPADFDHDDYLACVIRVAAQTMYHPLGTVLKGTVLDHQFRVKGISNLHVADASVVSPEAKGFPNENVVHIAKEVAHILSN